MQYNQDETTTDLDGEMSEAELNEVSGGTSKFSKVSLEKVQRLQIFTTGTNQGIAMTSNAVNKSAAAGSNITGNMK